jgi:ATP-dependent helicase/nuclease subunit A
MSVALKMPVKLTPSQQAAVNPHHDVWLSASAGSGKTQVLSARVIRLLLEDRVDPENLLCLTFTKAAASEMADRINRRLAGWVQMADDRLFHELEAIGAASGPDHRSYARKLFAKILDAPGGGLQIMTIHSFCQSLLAAFPEEAGLLPGFEPIEGRAQDEMLTEALAELVRSADSDGQGWIIDSIQQLSLDMGEASAFSFLKKCALRVSALRDLPDDHGALVFARHLVGLNFEGTIEAELGRCCADDVINRPLLDQLLSHNRGWNTKTGNDRADIISIWIAQDPNGRVEMLDTLHSCWATQKGTLVAQYNKKDPAFPSLAQVAMDWTSSLIELRTLADYSARLAQALLAGKAFSLRYEQAKHASGVIDYDDMITRAAQLLTRSGMADWVRYKLDRKIDHILIDEAQDTNAAQWQIVRALADDFYSGMAARGDKKRTLFAVGDFKQAIYGFQGTDPEKYRDAGNILEQKIADADEVLHRLSLAQSFRSTRPVLDFVNAVIDEVGGAAMGINDRIPDHYSELPDTGSIELMQLVSPQQANEDEDDADEQWLSEEKRLLAERIAQHVKMLVDTKPILASTNAPLKSGDILILLRKRTDLAALIVARLHALGVAVAGIDRLRITEPIAVQDLLAAIRFALQPKDDLSLACLLVSPLLGWSQEKLLKHGYRAEKVELWQHLRAQPAIEDELQPLRDMLATADLFTPYSFLENILSGPTQGRAKFLSRLGNETLVPVEELLNQALTYQQQGGASLQGFLDWFVKGGEIIKREGLAQSGDVRVMTVHGAKGLEAPVVILADIAVDPLKSGDRSIGPDLSLDGDLRLPLLPIRKAERLGQLENARSRAEATEMREQFRLLYVALTRSAERLILAGSLGAKAKGQASENSWFPYLEAAMGRLGAIWEPDSRWGKVMRFAGVEAVSLQKEETIAAPVSATISEPAWLRAPAPAEGNPPRPLSPSNLDDDQYGEAPVSDYMRLAALRGKLIHALFEHYDGREVQSFQQEAAAWLKRNDPQEAVDHIAVIEQITSVLANPDWASLFSKAARAEVPLAALVGTTVITGRVDRLLIEKDVIRLIDFKTGRKVPEGASEVAVPVLRQMAHYVAALETIFPHKRVEASLLYTSAPAIIALPDAILLPHKPMS